MSFVDAASRARLLYIQGVMTSFAPAKSHCLQKVWSGSPTRRVRLRRWSEMWSVSVDNLFVASAAG